MGDNVNHPAHYGGEADPYEAIKVIEAWGLGFHLGNAVKYIARAGKKGDMSEDLEKARWYIDRATGLAAAVKAEKAAERLRQEAVQEARDAESFANLKAGIAVARLSEAMRAEEEGERVPEVESAAGTPVWVEEYGDWRAYIGVPVAGDDVLYAGAYGWARWADDGRIDRQDRGDASTLAANIRAATASWNAAHPDLPPVIVPEQFREVVEVPEVEAPEDAGDVGPDDDGGWIAWEGGECPVGLAQNVDIETRNGSRLRGRAAGFPMWEYDPTDHTRGLDIVCYRIVQTPQPPCWCYDCKTEEERVTSWTSCPECHNKRCPKATHHNLNCTGSNEPGQPGSRYTAKPSQPPTDPEARVAAMTNDQVEVGLEAEGVSPWEKYGDEGQMWRPYAGGVADEAIDHLGMCWHPAGGPERDDFRFDVVKGDTTTPEGRAECSRRLLAHLLRAEEG